MMVPLKFCIVFGVWVFLLPQTIALVLQLSPDSFMEIILSPQTQGLQLFNPALQKKFTGGVAGIPSAIVKPLSHCID